MDSDFSSMDMSTYTNQIDQYQANLNTALDTVSGKNKTAQEKADRYNQILQTSLLAVGAPLLDRGIGKTVANVKKAVTKRIGDKVEDLKGQASKKVDELVENAKSKVSDLVNKNTAKPEGDIADAQPIKGIQETNLDEEISRQQKAGVEETDLDNPEQDFGADADEFDAGNMPEGSGGRVTLSEDSANADAENVIRDQADQASDGATDGADAGINAGVDDAGVALKAGRGAQEGSDLLDGLTTGSEIVAGSEGFLNPILDLAPLALGLGLTLTGLFKHKHAPTIPPPPAPNPTFTFGQ